MHIHTLSIDVTHCCSHYQCSKRRAKWHHATTTTCRIGIRWKYTCIQWRLLIDPSCYTHDTTPPGLLFIILEKVYLLIWCNTKCVSIGKSEKAHDLFAWFIMKVQGEELWYPGIKQSWDKEHICNTNKLEYIQDGVRHFAITKQCRGSLYLNTEPK